MNLANIRSGLVANLQSLAVSNGGPLGQISPYILASPTPPGCHVYPGRIDYHQAMRDGMTTVEMTVQAFVGFTTDVGAQQLLDGLLASSGVTSMKAAIESDRTLGGACDDLIVHEMSGYQVVTPSGRPAMLAAEWAVEVLT